MYWTAGVGWQNLQGRRSRNGNLKEPSAHSAHRLPLLPDFFGKEAAMKLSRRTFLHLTAGAAALPAVSRVARAQAYPTRPVRVIVGFPAGGVNDLHARLIGQWLSERLSQQFIIENRPGAGSNIAAEVVVKAAADGYTLYLSGSPNAISATLYDNLNFNFIRDIAPVAGIVRLPLVMVAHPPVPATTVREFIAH